MWSGSAALRRNYDLRGIPVPEQFADIFLEHYWHDPALADACRQSLRRALKRRAPFWRVSW